MCTARGGGGAGQLFPSVLFIVLFAFEVFDAGVKRERERRKKLNMKQCNGLTKVPAEV